MSTTAEQITALQNRLTAAHREHLRAEGAREAAQQSLDRVQKRLHTEWGVTGLPAARDALHTLTTELDTCIADLNALLDQLDGEQPL